VLAIRHNHTALLQVRVLEETVVLVGEANFVGFIAAFFAKFTNAGHIRSPFRNAKIAKLGLFNH
jgi:hypothetical protein